VIQLISSQRAAIATQDNKLPKIFFHLVYAIWPKLRVNEDLLNWKYL